MGCGYAVCRFHVKKLSLSTYFLSNCSFELLWVKSSKRFCSKISLSKTKRSSVSYFSNSADVCPVTLWNLDFAMEILSNIRGQLLLKGLLHFFNKPNIYSFGKATQKPTFKVYLRSTVNAFRRPKNKGRIHQKDVWTISQNLEHRTWDGVPFK